jgi:hypothetical protein
MRLDVGFEKADLSAAASMVERWLGQELESDDDLELGGHYFRYFPASLPSVGLCGVRVRQNHVEGLGWRLKHRPELPICAEIEVCGPELLELGRLTSRLGVVCGNLAAVAAYVVTRSTSEYPELLCNLTFGLETEDFTLAGTVASALLEAPAVEHVSEDLGGRYLALAGATHNGLVRRNQISLVRWLYPRHQRYALLLDVTWRTPNLLELGELALHVEGSAADQLTPIGYRVVGDLVRDRVPRLLSYEVEQ